MNNSGSVICVDLDGTLVRTDTLIETALLFIRLYPLRIPMLIGWLLQGRAYLKMQLARTAAPDATAWPYNDEVLSYIRDRKTAGAKLVLATGADRAIADNVARHLLIFDEVCSSDGHRNLVGEHKAELLARRYSAFEYVGNSMTDLPVWFRSDRAAVLSRSRRL